MSSISRYSRAICIAGILGGATPALPAAVTAAPASPRPGPPPGLWLGWSNDAFSGQFGDNRDDARTNDLAIQVRLDRWVVSAGHSILTDKPGGRRDDEATVAVARLFGAGADEPGSPWLGLGAAVRRSGRLGGAAMQRRTHAALGLGPVDNLAQDPPGTLLLGAAAAGWVLPWRGPTGPALLLAAAGEAGSSDRRAGEAAAGIALLGADGAVWVRLRAAEAAGGAGPVARRVAQAESGWWIDHGLSLGGWLLAGAVAPDDRRVVGTIGWMADRRPAGPGRTPIAGELLVMTGPALGADLRWPLVGEDAASALWWRVDVRTGRTGRTWPGNVVVHDQATLGIELCRPGRGWGFSLQPYAAAGAGWRAEQIAERGRNPTHRRQRADGPVAAAFAGLRLLWLDGGGNHGGLSLGGEGWAAPAAETDPPRRERYLGAGAALAGGVSVGVRW